MDICTINWRVQVQDSLEKVIFLLISYNIVVIVACIGCCSLSLYRLYGIASVSSGQRSGISSQKMELPKTQQTTMLFSDCKPVRPVAHPPKNSNLQVWIKHAPMVARSLS